MQNADLIDKFLTGTLTPEESALINKKIADDPPFAKELEEYQHTFEALKNKWLQNQIQQASQIASGGGSSIFSSIKLWIGLGAIAVATVLTVVLFNSKNNSTASEKSKNIAVESKKQNAISTNPNTETTSDTAISVIENPALINVPNAETINDNLNNKINSDNLSNSVSIATEKTINSNPTTGTNKTIKDNSQPEIIAPSKINLNVDACEKEIKKLAPKPQVFTIDNLRDTLITCKKGTRINFPMKCFAENNGIPNDNLQIKIFEYLTYKEFFAAGLSTASNGRLLNTGGMLYVEVSNAGQKVNLKKDSAYTIWLPTSNNRRDESMQTFYGKKSDTGINWDLNPQYPETGITDNQIGRKSTLAGAPFAIFEPIKIRSIGLDNKGYTNLGYVPTIKSTIAQKGLKWGRYIPMMYSSDTCKNYLQSLYDTFQFFDKKKLDKMVNEQARATVQIFLDTAGNVVEFQCVMSDKKLLRKYNDEYRDFVRSITPTNFKQYFKKDMMPENFEIFLSPIMKLLDTGKLDLDAVENDKTLATKAEKELSNFNRLLSYNTGWINCDRFNTGNSYQAWIKNAPENSQISIYFQNINSCLNVRTDVISLPNNSASTMIVVTPDETQSTMRIISIARNQEVVEIPKPEPFDLKKIAGVLDMCQKR